MHRTTTTAALLVTVAVSALAGCVTVPRPPVPGPSAAPAPPPVPRTDGRAEPRVVQAPAREALERVSPSREATPAARRPAPPAPPRVPPRSERWAQEPRPGPPHPEPRRPRDLPAVPERIQKDVRGDTDVCALGRKYGGWRPDSPEAVICRRAQGR